MTRIFWVRFRVTKKERDKVYKVVKLLKEKNFSSLMRKLFELKNSY